MLSRFFGYVLHLISVTAFRIIVSVAKDCDMIRDQVLGEVMFFEWLCLCCGLSGLSRCSDIDMIQINVFSHTAQWNSVMLRCRTRRVMLCYDVTSVFIPFLLCCCCICISWLTSSVNFLSCSDQNIAVGSCSFFCRNVSVCQFYISLWKILTNIGFSIWAFRLTSLEWSSEPSLLKVLQARSL